MKKSEFLNTLYNEFGQNKLGGNTYLSLSDLNRIFCFLEEQGIIIPPPIPGVYNPLLTPPTVNPSGTVDQGFHRAWEDEES